MFRFRVFLLISLPLLGMLWVMFGTGRIPLWPALVFLLLALIILVLASAKPSWQFYLFSHTRGDRNAFPRSIALSFDDGPDEVTAEILDILRSRNVKAIFFVIGEKGRRRPDLLRRIQEEGHIIGNHSYQHGFFFDLKSRRSMVEEIRKTNDEIEEVIGLRPRLFRPPYGVTNPNLAAALASTEMISVGWSLRSYDTMSRNPEVLRERLASALRPGDIILLHDNQPIGTEILASLIDQSREKGYTFVRLDQLISTHAYHH